MCGVKVVDPALLTVSEPAGGVKIGAWCTSKPLSLKGVAALCTGVNRFCTGECAKLGEPLIVPLVWVMTYASTRHTVTTLCVLYVRMLQCSCVTQDVRTYTYIRGHAEEPIGPKFAATDRH